MPTSHSSNTLHNPFGFQPIRRNVNRDVSCQLGQGVIKFGFDRASILSSGLGFCELRGNRHSAIENRENTG